MAYITWQQATTANTVYKCGTCQMTHFGLNHTCREAGYMRTPITEHTDFSVYIEQLSSSGSMSWRYQIYNAEDDPEYAYRYANGWGKNQYDCERKARKEIDKLMRPYRKPPTLTDFIPHFFKRIV